MRFRHRLVKYFEIGLLLVKHLKKFFMVQKIQDEKVEYWYSVNLLAHSTTIYICMTKVSLVNFQCITTVYTYSS